MTALSLITGLDAFGVIPVLGEIADSAKTLKMADKAIDTAKVVNKASDSRKALNKQKRGTPRSNKAQNRQTNDIGKRLKLTPKQQRELHDAIHGLNMGYQEILEFAKDWFGK